MGYECGRLPIRNVDDGRNAVEVKDMCDIPSFHEVRYERNTTTEVYISLFIYPREGLMIQRGTEDAGLQDEWGWRGGMVPCTWIERDTEGYTERETSERGGRNTRKEKRAGVFRSRN